jgi:hypothetical protein
MLQLFAELCRTMSAFATIHKSTVTKRGCSKVQHLPNVVSTPGQYAELSVGRDGLAQLRPLCYSFAGQQLGSHTPWIKVPEQQLLLLQAQRFQG